MAEREATVWAARLGRREEGVRGALALSADHLEFEAERGTLSLRLPLSSIQHVRRVIGSPVMVVEYEQAGVRSAVALYFTQPPPLPESGVNFGARRKGRMTAIRWLGRENKDKREEVKRWVEVLRGSAARE